MEETRIEYTEEQKWCDDMSWDLACCFETANNCLWDLAAAGFIFEIDHNLNKFTGEDTEKFPVIYVYGKNEKTGVHFTVEGSCLECNFENKRAEACLRRLSKSLNEAKSILFSFAEANFSFEINHNFESAASKNAIPFITVCGQSKKTRACFDWVA